MKVAEVAQRLQRFHKGCGGAKVAESNNKFVFQAISMFTGTYKVHIYVED